MANFAGLDVGPDNNTEFTQRLGIHQVYGFAPAYSLLEGACAAAAAETEPDEAAPLRVLVAGPSDGRHVLATLARRRRLPAHVRARPVEMHVWDKPLEALARTLLMLEMVHDFELPVRQRACVVLEVFGNAHLTERTARYVVLSRPHAPARSRAHAHLLPATWPAWARTWWGWSQTAAARWPTWWT